MTNARAPRGRRGFEALIKKMRDTGITRADILRFGIACALHTPDPDLAFVPLALIFEFPNQNQHARLDFVAQLYDKFVIIYHETRQAADRREDYENVVAAARAGGSLCRALNQASSGRWMSLKLPVLVAFDLSMTSTADDACCCIAFALGNQRRCLRIQGSAMRAEEGAAF